MPSSQGNSRIIRFGVFELDTANGELRKHGIRIRLQEQPFQILTALVTCPGEIVTREELVRRLWPEDTFVDFEHSLNAAVNRLRQVLGDSAETPRYIETVARRGYRFVGTVTPDVLAASAPAEPLVAAPVPPRVWTVRDLALIGGVMFVVAITCALYIRSSLAARIGPVLRQVTFDAGLTTEPAVAPDGSMVAYVSDRKGRNLNLWVQQLPNGASIQLTHGEVDVHSPSFSPDGKKIVFRSEQDGGALYVVPTLGGTPRLLVAQGRDARYSPDGKWIAYWAGTPMSSVPSAVPAGRVFVISSEGGAPRELGAQLPSAGYPIWSSDSRYLVVTVDPYHPQHANARSAADWYIVPIDGGVPIQTHAFEKLKKFDITEQNTSGVPKINSWIDGTIIFTASNGDAVNIWSARLSAPAGVLDRISRVTSGTNLEVYPSAGPEKTIIFASLIRNISIYMVRGDTNVPGFSRLDRVTEQSGSDITPSLSDDGRTLAFTCGKEASICVKDLVTGVQRTVTDGPHWNPRVSHDGSRIAYTPSGQRPLFVLPVAGGSSVKLADEGAWAFDWFHDNRRLLYGKCQSLQIRTADTVDHTDRTFVASDKHAVYQTQVSPDDKWVTIEAVSLSRPNSRIYVAPVRSNAAGPVSEWIPIGFPEGWDDKPRWSPNGALVYFISQHDGFLCLWAQTVDASTKRPLGEPFAAYHFHTARLSPMTVGLGALEMGIGPDKVVLNLGELSGNIWAVTAQ
jgi:Tol biopolymer transport system component/DNA-binding winged helix-turn-helix (wHTH) protein